MSPQRISILGSTGSVGCSTLAVVDHVNKAGAERKYEIDVLAAGRDSEKLAKQAIAHKACLLYTSDAADE